MVSKYQIDSSDFRKKYPRLYRRILKEYSEYYLHDKTAAIVLYLNKVKPICSICGKKVTISKKYRTPVEDPRCSRHINTNPDKFIKESELESAIPPHIKVISRHAYILPGTDITFKCEKHGEYIQGAGRALSGMSCQKCYFEYIGKSYIKPFETWEKECSQTHNQKYNYLEETYTGASNDVTIICPMHGEFTQNAGVHSRGHGCPKCYHSTKFGTMYDTREFVKKAMAQHGDLYDYSDTEYTGNRDKVLIKCKKHGVFEQVAYYHLAGNGCQRCGFENHQSSYEFEIIEFLKSNGIQNINHGDRSLGFEIDIFLPDYNIGIEYNGLYWHSSPAGEGDSMYHARKTNTCIKNNIRLFHIYGSEWAQRKDAWKSAILTALGSNPKRHIDKVCTIDSQTGKEFFLKNHVEENVTGERYIAGLDVNNNLIGCVVVCEGIVIGHAELNYTTVDNSGVLFEGINSAKINRRYNTADPYKKAGLSHEYTSMPVKQYTDTVNIFHSQNKENTLREIWDTGYEILIRK